MIQERLKELRQKKELTQVELARRVGISKHLYNKYERNNVRPSDDTLLKLAKELEVTFEYLVFGRDANLPTEKSDALAPEERRLLEAFRTVTEERIKRAILEIAEDYADANVIRMTTKTTRTKKY